MEALRATQPEAWDQLWRSAKTLRAGLAAIRRGDFQAAENFLEVLGREGEPADYRSLSLALADRPPKWNGADTPASAPSRSTADSPDCTTVPEARQ